jgi:hypothetical protein
MLAGKGDAQKATHRVKNGPMVQNALAECTFPRKMILRTRNRKHHRQTNWSVFTMLDNRSPLMKRLAEIMPKKPEQPKNELGMMRLELYPIRQSAESFAHWIGDELPANDEELRAMLWTFGEILNGEMERMLNESVRHNGELMAALPFATQIIEILKVKA